jgi:predicted nucleic acid-binding protein
MTLYLDSSALVAVVIRSAARQEIVEALQADTNWFSSALTLSESLALVPRLTEEAALENELENSIRLLWDRIAIVPVDQTCLDCATKIMRKHPLKISSAVHLAAAIRLPRPITYATVDPDQIVVAISMGFNAVTPCGPV